MEQTKCVNTYKENAFSVFTGRRGAYSEHVLFFVFIYSNKYLRKI
jgi:hypothetical protein